ncbi:MAG TPA: aldose 1-epimerase [Chitinophagales bacterium]|nr:aldose 1-epimerase [Chitinophagales bacterium]
MAVFESRKSSIDGFDVIELYSEDQSAHIILDIGNTLYNWTWKGKQILWFPYSLDSYLSSEKLAGNPLMYPWANRLSSEVLKINGEECPLDGGNLYKDANDLPLHGLLLKSGRWVTKDMGVDDFGAWHTAQYESTEIFEIIEQFPFMHTLEMTHRLDNDGIDVNLKIINLDDKNLPLSFGFHPYFNYQNYNRADILINIPYESHVETDKFLLPTGELHDIEDFITKETFSLSKLFLDDGFVHKISGKHPSFQTPDYKVEVVFDDEYQCCVVYAPTSEDKKYLCIEPMIAPTNSWNKVIDNIETPYVLAGSQKEFSFKMKISAKDLADDI